MANESLLNPVDAVGQYVDSLARLHNMGPVSDEARLFACGAILGLVLNKFPSLDEAEPSLAQKRAEVVKQIVSTHKLLEDQDA